MNDKEKEFIERVKCGIAYCEDIPVEIEQKAVRKDGDGTMCDLLNKEIEELTNQNEIEEMAKSIYESKVALDGTDLAFGLIGDDDHFHRIAIYLYNAGYRNIKDKVAIYKEEYEELLSIQRTHAEDLTNAIQSYDERIADLKIEYDNHFKNLEKIIDRQCRDLNSQADRIIDLKEELRQASELKAETIKLAKMETAREILKALKNMAYQSNDWSHGEHPMVVEVDSIEEIAEKYGVEVE